jgi:hypothetical protein
MAWTNSGRGVWCGCGWGTSQIDATSTRLPGPSSRLAWAHSAEASMLHPCGRWSGKRRETTRDGTEAAPALGWRLSLTDSAAPGTGTGTGWL